MLVVLSDHPGTLFVMPTDPRRWIPSLETLDRCLEFGPYDYRYYRWWRPGETKLRQAVIDNDLVSLRRWIPCMPVISCVAIRIQILVGELGRVEVLDLLVHREFELQRLYGANTYKKNSSHWLIWCFFLKGACKVGNLDMARYVVGRSTPTYQVSLDAAIDAGHQDVVDYLTNHPKSSDGRLVC